MAARRGPRAGGPVAAVRPAGRGTALITTGGVAPADLLPFLLLGLGLTAPVAALGHGFDDIQAARRAVGRIREVLAVPPLPEPAHPVAPQGHRVDGGRTTEGFRALDDSLRDVQRASRRSTLSGLPGVVGSALAVQAAFTVVLTLGAYLALGGALGAAEVLALLVLAARCADPLLP